MVPVLTALMLTGCGSAEPPEPITAVPSALEPVVVAEPPVEPTQTPEIDLRPLPTPEEVIAAAPGGRQDPFQPLPLVAVGANGQAGVAIGSPTTLLLTGVIDVGGVPRALVRLLDNTSVLCLGSGGRCDADGEALLPEGWAVVAIDIEGGCVTLALEGEAQDPVCMV